MANGYGEAVRREVTFSSHGVRCAAWHIAAATGVLTGPWGRPCVVMAHGCGGTWDSGLDGYAKSFADAGVDAFVFAYRGFDASECAPRQNYSARRQREDYHAALAAARRLPGVDPDRIALWGTANSGGHVAVVAAEDGRVAAAVSLTPVLDEARRVGAAEVCAEVALESGSNRTATFAERLSCPILVQVGTNDRVAPPDAAHPTATTGQCVQLREYPVDHFALHAAPWQQRVAADQVGFLSRALDPSYSSCRWKRRHASRI